MQATKQQILEAAFATLKEDGFAAATSRAVARRGGFNPALVFYYFGSMDALLLAALDWTNELRLAAYRERLAGETTAEAVLSAAQQLFEPDLAPQMLERMQPWLELCEQTLERVAADSPLAAAFPRQELAHAIVTFYLGANLLTHLEADRA